MHSNSTFMYKLKSHKNQNCTKQSFSLSLLNIQSDLYASDIFAHNDQDCAGIDLALLSSAVRLKLSALTIRPQIHTCIRNDENYTERRSNFVNTGKKIMNEL